MCCPNDLIVLPPPGTARAAFNSLIVLAVMAATSINAATAQQHPTKFNFTRVQPLLDVPMIDAAIARAPGGDYYLIGGAGWQGDYRSFGTYDSEVFWAKEIGGPWHPNLTVLPHGGNSGILQDDASGWWHVSFANDNLLPDIRLLRCLPIEIHWNGRG
jgi:hypothetical protein